MMWFAQRAEGNLAPDLWQLGLAVFARIVMVRACLRPLER